MSPNASSPRGSREMIIDAVVRVVSTRGSEDLTVRKVAAEAGVSVGAVQHHFPTRAALIIGAMDAVTARFRNRVGAALAGADSARERLRLFCEELAALTETGRSDAIVWTAFAARAGTDPDVRAIHEREWQRAEESLQTLLETAYPAADITPDDAAFLLAVLDGIAVARGAERSGRMPSTRGRALIASLLERFAGRVDG